MQHWQGPIWDFYRLMSAVLAANLLTLAICWGFYNYSRLEREGREHDRDNHAGTYLGVIIMVFGFLLFGFVSYGFFDRLIFGS
jgi:hypothetical protein